MEETSLLGNFNTRKSKINRGRTIFIVCMLSFAIVNFLVFWVYVNFSSILLAFQSPGSDGFTLINFTTLFKEFGRADSTLSNAFKNTLMFFVVSAFVINPLSLIFSYFLYKRLIGYKVFRIVFFLPSIISVVVMTSLYGYMVAPDGIITKILVKVFNMDFVPILLGESRYALATILAYNIWTGFGVNIILFNGAMARIPTDIIEYNRLEGVGFIRELFQIILPLIWPTISTVILLSIVGIFNASGPILFFTLGSHNTYTISYWIFEQVYMKSIYEYAAAVGLFFSAIGLPLVLFAKWGLGKVGNDIEY